MQEFTHFEFCPNCGARDLCSPTERQLLCQTCGLVYYHNTATAVGLVIEHDGEILLTQRGREPAKGLYDFPGGFVDYGESLEQAVSREIREELGLQITEMTYLCSASNDYLYKDIRYQTADVYFSTSIASREGIHVMDDVQGYKFVDPTEINAQEIAFASVKKAIDAWLDLLT